MDHKKDAEIEALKEMLDAVRSAGGKNKEPEGEEDYLDPASLAAAEEALEGTSNSPEEAVTDVNTAVEEESEANGMPLDLEEVRNFFKSKPDEGRKPLKSLRGGGASGPSEMASSSKFGKTKRA